MTHANEPSPRFRAPAGACDAHFHVFGRPGECPYASAEPLRYVPLEDYLDLAKRLGFERFVFVQPSAYCRDNACMLDAMRRMDRAARRGIVDVDEDVPDATLAEMHCARRPRRADQRLAGDAAQPWTGPYDAAAHPPDRRPLRRTRLASRCPDPRLADRGAAPDTRHVALRIQHRPHRHVPRKDGPEQPGFRRFVEMLRTGGLRGWVKLTGAYRMAAGPDFADALPMARALIEAVPHRLIWGGDYPHLSFADTVGSVQLFNLIADWAPDDATHALILTRNPAELFGF
jgi:predicted TIM-barrel fold metal-dependent hydrolase